MDLLPRLGVSLVILLIGVAFIVWSTRIMVFPGSLLGLIEDFLPEAWRSNFRRVINSFFGLVLILVALLIFFVAGAKSSKPPADSASRGAGSVSATGSAAAESGRK